MRILYAIIGFFIGMNYVSTQVDWSLLQYDKKLLVEKTYFTACNDALKSPTECRARQKEYMILLDKLLN